jgi:3',5'-cyclic AMP phosphodiesterase CpdA
MNTAVKRILAGVALLAFLGSSTLAGSAPLRFVQITDTHLGAADHLQRTRRIVESVNRLPFEVACVVHTGDIFADAITDERTLAEGLAVLKRLKAPLHLLPGNHDILTSNLQETLRVYTQRVGPLIDRREYRGVVFVFAYTEPLALGFEANGFDAMGELKKALEAAAGKPVLLFHHRPAVEDYYEYALYPGWGVEARRRFEGLLGGFDVKAVITGHFHRDELHWSGAIPVFAAPPVAGFWGRQASFRLYEYREGKLAYRTIYLPAD